MTHASPLATQGKTQAQPWTVNRLAGCSRRRSLDVYKLAEALSAMVWHDFDKWNKS
ncbi:MAG: hypothetical protein JRI92_05670 [Deltaproteobacteria bacterium]|nr:hypothetical protein [Deltaproteobacteria bacterium]